MFVISTLIVSDELHFFNCWNVYDLNITYFYEYQIIVLLVRSYTSCVSAMFSWLSWLNTCLIKSCLFGLPFVSVVSCCWFMYKLLSLLASFCPWEWDITVLFPDLVLSYFTLRENKVIPSQSELIQPGAGAYFFKVFSFINLMLFLDYHIHLRFKYDHDYFEEQWHYHEVARG